MRSMNCSIGCARARPDPGLGDGPGIAWQFVDCVKSPVHTHRVKGGISTNSCRSRTRIATGARIGVMVPKAAGDPAAGHQPVAGFDPARPSSCCGHRSASSAAALAGGCRAGRLVTAYATAIDRSARDDHAIASRRRAGRPAACDRSDCRSPCRRPEHDRRAHRPRRRRDQRAAARPRRAARRLLRHPSLRHRARAECGLGRRNSRASTRRSGVWAILGNHDWWNGVRAVRGALARSAFPCLENRAVLLGEGSDAVLARRPRRPARPSARARQLSRRGRSCRHARPGDDRRPGDPARP